MGNHRILVVEDDALSGKFIQQDLIEQGYDVPEVVTSGKEVMEKISEEQPDLILMDIKLKGEGDGIAAALNIASRYDIPIIYLTAHTDRDTILRAKITKPYGFLVKPINMSELHVAVEFAFYRHQMERKLKMSEERYRAVVETIPLLICRFLSDKFVITFVNGEYCRYSNLPREELIGKSFLDLIPGPEREKVVSYCRSLRRERPVATYEYFLSGASGGRWQRWTVQGLYDDQGAVIEYQAAGEDVTELKEIEMALRESEKKFRFLFEQSADAQLLIDGNRIVDCNVAAVNLLGARSKEQMFGKSPHELSPETQPSGTPSGARMSEILKFVYELDSISFEWAHRCFDGRQVPVDATYTIITIAGKPMVHAVLKDITIRKLAQQALRRSEQQYRALVETMSDGLVQGDEKGTITFVNDRFCEMVGYPKNEMIGRSVLEVISEDDRENFWDGVRRKRQALRGAYEIALKGKSGAKISTIASLRPLMDDLNRLAGIVAVFTDISERKSLEHQILEISMMEQQRIGRDLHDDLGQILTGTGFLCESLVKKLGNKGLPETEEARSIFGLINEAKEHTRLLSRGLSPVEIDSGGIVAALERFARNVESIYSVSCTLHCDAGLDINDSMVETQFHYIVLESVTNAIRHGRANHIDIALRKIKGQVHLAIKDDGSGIPPDVDPHKGMGLQIMRYRANAVGASIQVSANRGKGSTVTCILRR
jgi:PAS domain S-box-containing protein